MPLLDTLWREVSRHLGIEALSENAFSLLQAAYPVTALVLRRCDARAGRSIVVAAQGASASGDLDAVPAEVGPATLDLLAAWIRTGQPLAPDDPRPPVLRELFRADALHFDDPGADVYVVPIADADEPLGYLVLGTPAGLGPRPDRETLAQLREPFAVALQNDARVRTLEQLREAVEADKRALLSRLDRSEMTEALIGVDSGLRNVMRRVEQVAPSEAPVLLLGETGSGKEVVARAIHQRSRRVNGPLVRVNCGAIPPEMIDAELFGHDKGSFTGALADRRGWFERADGGTLLLDEVGELPLAAQVRLLRVLQDGTFYRVGGQRPLRVDVRIVAATHRDLGAMVAHGTFREDLWYRLSVFPISIPPLRSRLEDIGPLAAHFAARTGKRLSGIPLKANDADVALLKSYPWPGNVRELAAVVERAGILGDGRRLEVAAALGMTASVERRAASFAAALPPPALISGPFEPAPAPRPTGSTDELAFETLEQAMERHIRAALSRTRGRIEGPRGAAALLDINPHTLRSRMRKMGLEWSSFRDA
jgi:transcriptional regulator with GAF, ATPase, and Fis domain